MKLRTLIFSFLILVSLAAPAAEYIESFHSDIEVRRNGDLYVTETIHVKAEGKSIRRGIYRDFPTRYRDARGRDMSVGFEVLSVKRDGMMEPFNVRTQANGKRVYIGDKNTFLPPGFYEYELSYLTTRQLGFFEDFDELYWNVTGTGWDFPINRASATVTLPDTVADFELSGYTGKQGSTEQNLVYRRAGNNRVYFVSSEPLGRGEGLTIVAGWPKGLIDEPSDARQLTWFLADNKASLIIGAGVFALLVYYLLLWHWVGRDPEAGVVIPRYRAPEGYSPASMRFIERMGYDNKCFTTAIINLAVKGAVDINDDKGNFRIIKQGGPKEALAPGEAQVVSTLFKGGSDNFNIVQSNQPTLSKAIDKHKKSLQRDYEKIYFNTNRWLLAPGILATLILAVSAIASLPSEESIMKTVFLGAFSMVPLIAVYSSIRRLLRRGKKGLVHFAVFLAPLFVFLGIFYSSFPFGHFVDAVSVPLILGITAMLVLNYLFYQWLKAPTMAGRRLLDQVEGFKHYLEVAEEDDIALKDAPTFTADLYEAYLPYAIALDLENEWSAKLNRAIASGLVDRGYSHPRWYHSHDRSNTHFSNVLSSSLNSAIASSSVAPGSSSGSSGGSSGGGGGGGGGGGW